MIGIAIITCNREEMYRVCIDSIQSDWYNELVTVNDGFPINCTKGEYIETSGGEGVGRAKNTALKYLLKMGCEYIILVEDDMKFKANIFKAYIDAHKKTGIHHFMFGYHGPANKAGISGGKPVPRKVIDYGDVKIALNQHCVGAVTFYTKESLEDVGLYDEEYTNAFEHVDHSYMLAKKGYSTPYWWWADLADSLEFVEEQACSEENSSIRPRDDWQSNIIKSSNYFFEKHKVTPVKVKDAKLEEVVKFIKLKTPKDKISFIVHYREDTPERLENLHIVYQYYKDIWPNCEFVFVEDDVKQTIKQFVREEDKYIFFENDDVYKKCESYNIGFKQSTSNIVCFLDIDCLVSISSLILATNKVKKSDDVSFIGYSGVALYTEYRLKDAVKDLRGTKLFDTLVKNVDTENVFVGFTNSLYTVGNTNAVGGCLIGSRKLFEDINAFNPNFIGWGFEDNEVISRLKLLKKKVSLITPLHNPQNYLFHLPHEPTHVGERDKSKHKYYKHNHTEVSKVEAMEFDELKEYIKTW